MEADWMDLIDDWIDMHWVRTHTLELNRLEEETANSDFIASTDYILDLLRESGFTDIERYALPCDGVTTYDDCTMPLAWDRTGQSTLEIVSPKVAKAKRLLADSEVEPLNASIWSPPTPEGGVTAELIDFHSIESADFHEVKGKIVLYDDSPVGEIRRRLALAGAIGLVSYVGAIAETNPDDVRWMNGTGHRGWYYVKDDPMLWNFSITPRRGQMLAKFLANGKKVLLHAEMKTRVYPGEIYTVTARIPGKSRKEFALIAHMYEPFPADDAAGVVLSIAVGKALRELAQRREIPELQHSLRVVFSFERYGLSEFFHNKKRSGNILAAVNMDSVCHPTLDLAGIPLELRHSPASAPGFYEILMRNLLGDYFPELCFRETPGNLSDDTFGADSAFGIPTSWLHTPPAPGRHHNNGMIFGGIDWKIAKKVLTLTASVVGRLLTARAGHGAAALAREIFAGVKRDAVRDLKRLEAELKRGKVNAYAANFIRDFLIDHHTRRVLEINRFVPGTIAAGTVRKTVRQLAEKFAPQSGELDIYELTPAEARMAYCTVRRDPAVAQIMSMARLPEAERRTMIAEPTMLLTALLDGQRTLYEAFEISNFMLAREPRVTEAPGLMEYFRKLAGYGYFTLQNAAPLEVSDLTTALKELDVKHNAKLIVHSAYSALGGVTGGPEAVAKALVDYCGSRGVLLMPSFNFPFYMGRSADAYFDVQNTPSCVGVVTDAFRRMPNVARSLNPSHSFAVYGKKNFDWIEGHHRTLTMGAESPLGRLEKEDGYALMIGCASSVTFMHVVETTNRVHCLGYRNEEFPVKLPDGRVVPVRTWGWRGGHCRAYNTNAIFDWLRKRHLVHEVMVRHACLQYFRLSDYRKAYEATVLHHPTLGCMQCPNLPRVVKSVVPSDWDWERNAPRSNTSAFTGAWLENEPVPKTDKATSKAK